MTRGNEEQIIGWLERNNGKIILPHIGVLTHIERIGKANDNRKKADIKLNNFAVSLKDVQASFLYNKATRSDLLKYLKPSDLDWFDQQILNIHNNKEQKRNVRWQDGLEKERFQVLLRVLMMQMNPKTGISEHPADFLLTHPRITDHIIDICVYTFDEFFNIFAEDWITFAFKRHWPGQGDPSESNRAKRILRDSNCSPWVLDGVSGNGPKSWAVDAPPPEQRKTCFTCSIEISSPFKKWETLREFRLSLLNSGFFGVDSEKLERVTHKVQEHFGDLVHKQEDQRWTEVLAIATQILLSNS